MATSGIKVYTTSVQNTIKKAFFQAGIYRVNDSIPAEDYAYALGELNEITKTLQSGGFNIWNDKRAVLFSQYSTSSYILGGASATHATESYSETTLSVAAISGAGTITVTSDDEITNGDFIGIIKDSGLIFWTTVNGVPVANVVTLTDNLDGAAASGKTVFNYTTKITKPLEVTQVTLQQGTNNEVVLTRMPRERYFNLSDKAAIGSPNQFYFLKRRLDGVLYIWTTASDVSQPINFTYQPYLDNLVNQADELDFPIEWAKPITWTLASELCTPYGIKDSAKIDSKANYWMTLVKSDDNENSSLIFEV